MIPPRPAPAPTLRPATAQDLALIEAWLRDEEEQAGGGFFCNWKIIANLYEEQAVFVVDVGGDPVAFLANEGVHHLIAEVRPDQRGRGHGRAIAEAMIEQSTTWGLSVIQIACAPETSVPFWTRMGFTPVHSRRGYGGGVYAYREIPRRQTLGRGERVPFAVRFYDEGAHHRGGEPFRTYQGEGELRSDRCVVLPERATCFGPTVLHLNDCYAEIEIEGRRLFRDKTKREEATALGIERDAGGIPFIEALRLPAEPQGRGGG